MMEGWEEIRLDNISKVIMGLSPKGDSYNTESIGTPLLNGPTEFGETYPDCTLYTTDPKRICKKGDLIFCVRGSTTGRMNWADKNYALGRGVCSITGVDNLTTKFIKHLLTINLPGLLQITGGGTFPNLRKEDINGFKFKIPKKYREIASILSAYDDLIENNLKRIALMEEQAQQTYEEWFVRLKFPGYEGVAIDAVSGLPEGWEMRDLGDVIVNFDSKRIPVSRMEREKMQGKFPYYGAASIMDYVDDYLFDGRYVLMGEDGTVITNEGYPKLQFVEGKIWVNNHAHVLQGTEISNEFLFLFLNQYPIQGHVTGVAQPKINQKNLNRISIIYAADKIRLHFDKIVKPLFDLNFNLQTQNKLLKEARDILLPRLMSGMINVDKLISQEMAYELSEAPLGQVAEPGNVYNNKK